MDGKKRSAGHYRFDQSPHRRKDRSASEKVPAHAVRTPVVVAA